jgi:N12 class adenine-specific DNA methylase
LSFDKIVANMMQELTKLNVQGHVHAQELYSALNIIRRCPPGPLLAFLVQTPGYKHVGDMHFRMAGTENEDE